MKKILLLLILISSSVFSQNYNMQNGTFSTCSGTFYDSGGNGGNYAANENYQITFCPSTPGTYVQLQFTSWNVEGEPFDFMTIYEGTGTSGAVIGIYGDTAPMCGGMTIASSHPSGCITITFESDSSFQYGGWAATISCKPTPGGLSPSVPPNSLCSGADPFCADAGPLQFPNVSGGCVPNAPAVVTNNTCLSTAPRPAWYYLEIDQAGPLNLQISQTTGPNGTGTGLDVDFAIWGPFSNQAAACADFTQGDCTGDHACSGNVVDCSYSAAATETAVIPNAQVGEIYMVMVTNYDGAAGFITMTQTNSGPGAGSTDCSIVCPTASGTNPTCGASNGSITIDGLNPSTSYTVNYSDDGTPVSVTLTSNAAGQIIISGLNAGNYTNIITNFPGCAAAFSNVVLSGGGASASLIGVTSTTSICSGSNAVYNLTGTANATVTYNINGGTSQTVTLSGTGTASVTVPTVTANTTFNAISIAPIGGAPVTGNCLSASGGNNSASASGAISALGATASAANCAFVDATNSVLTITLQHTVPAGTSITISIARDTNQGDVTISDGTASTTFNAGPNDVLQYITLVTGVSTNTITVTRTNGIVWVDGVQYSTTPPVCTATIAVSNTVVVNSQPNAGTDGATTICDSSTASIDLFGLITGEQTGGTWTRLTGTGGIFNAVAGTFIPASGATTSTFQYSLTGTAPCINDVSVATININPQPNAGTDANTTVCESNATPIDLFSLITGEQAGGTWTRLTGTGGTFNAAAGTFVPAIGTTASSFQYSLTGTAPCSNDVSVVTISIRPQANAGLDGTYDWCASTHAAIHLDDVITGQQNGGVWAQTSGLGGTFNPMSAIFTPSVGSVSATFTYTVPGVFPCPDDVSIATINIINEPNAGTDGTITICDSNTSTIDLFGLIAGEQSGGTWTRLTGTGGTFNATAGTFIAAPGVTTSTFQYSVGATGPCIEDVSVATITIYPQKIAGTDGATTICDTSTASIDLFGLITGEQPGGTWTRLTGTGGTFNAAAGTFTPALGATSSTFRYFMIGTAPCVDDVSLATITINAQPNAGTDGATTICDSNTASINLFGLITGEQAGGTWTRLTGTGGTFNSAAGTFVPAPGATSSTFQYFLTGTAPCIDDMSVATININAQPNAGSDGAVTICDSNTASIDLFGLITGEQAGGTWTRLTGTGGTFNAAAGTFVPAPGATSSTFQYFLPGTAPCVNDMSVATININAQPNAGSDGAVMICDSNTASIDLFGLITGEQAGGTWTRLTGTGGTFNASAGTFVPAPGATSSTFQYSLTGTAPCIDDVSVATININAQPNAGTDGATTICDSNTSTIDLFGLITGEQAGGTWTRLTGTGGTFNAAAGTFVAATGATTSTFQYSLIGTAPCVNDLSVATININPQHIAGADGATTICDSNTASIDLFGLISGEQPGGTWTRLTGTGGTFNAAIGTFVPAPGATSSTFQYFLTGTAPCVDDVSLATITINPQPNAGTDGAITICDSSTASINLFGLITGEQAGGTWTRLTGTGGTFNAAAGTFVPAPGATSSTFQYSLTGTAPCIDDVSVATININAQPNAGTDGATTICDSNTSTIDLFGLITGEQAGGTWTRLTGTGGTFNAAAGTFVAATGATTSTFQYSLIGTAPCVNDLSVATININPQHIAGADGATTICDSNTASIDLFGLISGEQPGGSWTRLTGTGGTFNAAAGTFVPAPGATSSTFQYFLTGTAPCVDDVSVATININAQPNAGTDGATTICDSNTSTIDLFGLITGEQAGGTWTRLTGTGGIFNAATGTFVSALGATTSTFQYSLTATAPCINDVSLATININPQPNVIATQVSQTICSGITTNIALSSVVPATTYTWTVVQTGVIGASNGSGNIISQELTALGTTVGTAVYTITPTANGCVGIPKDIVIMVNPTPTITATPVSGSICSGQSTSVVFSSNIVGTTYSWTVNQAGVSGATAGSGNTISQVLTATGSVVGTVTYTVTPMFNGCSGTPLNITVTVTPRATMTATAAATSICSGETATVTFAGSLPGTTYSWNVVQTAATGASNGSGLLISQVLTATGNTPGQAVYTITPVTDGCPGIPVTVIIAVNPIPVAGASPSSQMVCSGTATNIVLTSNLPNTTFTWNVIQTGVYGAAAGSGDIIAQTLSTVALVPGIVNYIITPHTNGCVGTPITVTVTVNPMPEVFGSPSNTEICSGENAEFSLTPNIPGTNFTWTVVEDGVRGASNGSGNTNPVFVSQPLITTGPNTGTVTYTIVPSANGCDGNPITISFTVNPLPQPQIQDGSICINQVTGAVISTYPLNTGLSDSNHDFVWFLDGTEIMGATGSIYVADQAGFYSVLVTDSVTGCVSEPVEVTVTESFPGHSLDLYLNEAFSDNQTITAVVTGGSGNYEYQLDGGAYQASNVFSGVSPGWHEVHVIDASGCTNLTQTIFVISYPNYFTPNGDGYNDSWNIWDLQDQPNAEIFIFDRYGKLIKQIASTGDGWDGTYNGHPLPSTDYWFTVKFRDGINKEERLYKSHFSMKR